MDFMMRARPLLAIGKPPSIVITRHHALALREGFTLDDGVSHPSSMRLRDRSDTRKITRAGAGCGHEGELIDECIALNESNRSSTHGDAWTNDRSTIDRSIDTTTVDDDA
jgi:hypothetical protein